MWSRTLRRLTLFHRNCLLSLPLGWTASSALSGWSSTLQSHLTWFPTQLSHGALGQAVVLGLPPPSGYVITQKLPAVPQPHTEFPNKTCENSCDGNSGHCWQPCGCRAHGQALEASCSRCEWSLHGHCLWDIPRKRPPWNVRGSMLLFWLRPNQMESKCLLSLVFWA